MHRTAWSFATEDFAAVLTGSARFQITLAAVSAIAAGVTAFVGSISEPGTAGTVVLAILGGIGGFAMCCLGLFTFALVRAPYRQRDEAWAVISRLTPDDPFTVRLIAETSGFFAAGGLDPNEQYVQLGVQTSRRIERVWVRIAEAWEALNGHLVRVSDFGPVNLAWSSRETGAKNGRQFLNINPGSEHIVDIAVCGRGPNSTNIRAVAVRGNRPTLPGQYYKLVVHIGSDSPDTGFSRRELALYRLDRGFTTLFLQEWSAIGEALVKESLPADAKK